MGSICGLIFYPFPISGWKVGSGMDRMGKCREGSILYPGQILVGVMAQVTDTVQTIRRMGRTLNTNCKRRRYRGSTGMLTIFNGSFVFYILFRLFDEFLSYRIARALCVLYSIVGRVEAMVPFVLQSWRSLESK